MLCCIWNTCTTVLLSGNGLCNKRKPVTQRLQGPVACWAVSGFEQGWYVDPSWWEASPSSCQHFKKMLKRKCEFECVWDFPVFSTPEPTLQVPHNGDSAAAKTARCIGGERRGGWIKGAFSPTKGSQARANGHDTTWVSYSRRKRKEERGGGVAKVILKHWSLHP